MPKTAINEVEVLRFFESEPLDKAATVYNIVVDKMQARLRADHSESPATHGRRRGPKAADNPTPEPTSTE
jgi:hypothetical protein